MLHWYIRVLKVDIVRTRDQLEMFLGEIPDGLTVDDNGHMVKPQEKAGSSLQSVSMTASSPKYRPRTDD